MKIYNSLALALIAVVLASCAGAPDLQSRLEAAQQQSGSKFQEIILGTSQFDLFVLAMPVSADGSLTIFIEGDGYAWQSRSRPSNDPTPITQTVLSLATAQTSGNVAYLARPCQFVGADSRNCNVSLWTGARYSEPVVAALDEAISYLLSRQPTQTLRLIGYSGGGTLAALLAARRTDVSSFVTIAAPLDIDAFTTHHGVTPLTASLNPRDYVNALAIIPQVHIVGGEDDVIPEEIASRYLDALPNQRCVQMLVVPDATHWSGWLAMRPLAGNIVTECQNRL